ncbi:EXS family-domain-containing protein [Apodospora peruviana]|uniref:EXS family-domain-containing protein n=1 Tax=Apodospora peruviana TaxID=516989 RepID=A0AAE0II95_9PEZI|nr:EXS family-domain-containing protein [Apodospora peruviana]
MKFAKELDQDAVPEWRVKYLNYKAGKKHIKTVTRAIHRANGTPNLGRRGVEIPSRGTPNGYSTLGRTFTRTSASRNDSNVSIASNLTPASPPKGIVDALPPSNGPGQAGRESNQQQGADTRDGERAGLAQSPGSGMQYGSFGPPGSRASGRTEFELPAPAIKVPSRTSPHSAFPSPPLQRLAPQRSNSMMAAVPNGPRVPSPLNLPAGSVATTPRHRLARIFSTGSPLTRQASNKADIGMQNLDYVRSAERDFFFFLDNELAKIESFYKQKEDQASQRLVALREQLHEMRNRRTTEIAEAKRQRELERSNSGSQGEGEGNKDTGHDWITPIRARLLKPGPNSKALQKMAQTPRMTGQEDDGRDYVRRPQGDDVPYRTAKRKLKLALQEFYRGLELLKSYALLNRTAFRKLNKKYDKAVNARPTYRYMNEKVNKSWFVNSDILDGHIRTVEDLYARYFERGNHKIAAGKLRNLNRRPGDASASTFRSGLLIGCGAVFAIQGLIYGSELLFDPDITLATNTSYLMQIYGGYFLILLLFVLFTLACRVWTKNKVNYPFIFEFDTRNNLDWKQLAEFPSGFFALFGVFIWLNFSRYGDWEDMYLYYPVLLITLSLIVLFLPAPILHHKARRWFFYSHYRLFFAGLYPVEFRDFFLGDIWCSLTYATCNVSLFFCLYAHYWNDPVQCNSNHSRLMGFLGALPPIWRALQCIRRYLDTKNVFPHLVNCGKYTMSILTAVFLSLFRIDDTQLNLSFFITFATINAVYCSIWDLFMDFSLLQAHARHRYLRDITALKPWVYYVIMTIDPILRFSWIFYAIFTHNTQHSTVVSFAVALAEVTRRGLWAIVRVENEHCANVAQYKASRDTPLPYRLEQQQQQQQQQRPILEPIVEDSCQQEDLNRYASADRAGSVQSIRATGVDVPPPGSGLVGAATEEPSARRATEEGSPGASGSGGGTFRRRYADTMGKKSILRIMADAHKQDFEKRRPPAEEMKAATATAAEEEGEEDEDGFHSEEDDDDDEDSGSLQEERMRVREAERLMKRGENDGEDGDDDDHGWGV